MIGWLSGGLSPWTETTSHWTRRCSTAHEEIGGVEMEGERERERERERDNKMLSSIKFAYNENRQALWENDLTAFQPHDFTAVECTA